MPLVYEIGCVINTCCQRVSEGKWTHICWLRLNWKTKRIQMKPVLFIVMVCLPYWKQMSPFTKPSDTVGSRITNNLHVVCQSPRVSEHSWGCLAAPPRSEVHSWKYLPHIFIWFASDCFRLIWSMTFVKA